MTGPDPVRLSVVIPTRNAAPWIEETLESVLQQRVDAMEVLVLDNGSSDATGSIVDAAGRRDGRVRRIASPATSAGDARNEGVDVAVGEYLVFADSDDLVPDGAYEALLGALDESGSDMAVGDHLKFSSVATWSPTERWYPFDRRHLGARPTEHAGLLAGRACWNRVFRRSFWDRAGLRFPSLASLEDMLPMTRALVEARTIDVVPDCVYLYRERDDASSLSRRADAATTRRYLEQEQACAELVRGDDALRAEHELVVLDADGWAHLSRFLSTAPDADETALVDDALGPLLGVLDLHRLAEVGPPRRMLWGLLVAGEWPAAARFVAGTDPDDRGGRATAWLQAVDVLRAVGDPHGLLAGLVSEGLLPALVNGADAVDRSELQRLLVGADTLPVTAATSELVSAMQTAVVSGSADVVADVSALRHVVPLVVDRVDGSTAGVVVEGPLAAELPLPLTLELRLGAAERSVTAAVTSGRWRADVSGDDLDPGRWSVAARLGDLPQSFPVVTARMPLPPLDDGYPVQPLADRKDGWRFLLDRRTTARKGLAGVLGRVRGRLR